MTTIGDDREVAPPRTIGGRSLAALTVNCVVGVGILGLPGRVDAAAGSYMIPVVLAAALLAIAAALCLAELGSRFEASVDLSSISMRRSGR